MDKLEVNKMEINTRGRVPGDDAIEASLNAGGQYAVVENPASQQEWEYLVDYLNQFPDPTKIKVISLPVDVCFYSLAYSETKLPTFYVTAKETGEMIITVDSKGSFVPNLTVEGTAGQTALGNDIYEIRFATVANYTYEIEINEPLSDKGLYSIVARHKKGEAKTGICEGLIHCTGAALRNGDVYVWGSRSCGEQGNGANNVHCKSAPAKVKSLKNVVQLTSGICHLLALDANGDVFGWGGSPHGQTGICACSVNTPFKVLTNAVQIAAGKCFSVALDKNGKVWAWGHNTCGELGDGGIKSRANPVVVNLQGETARLIGTAYKGTFAVTKEGHVFTWGDNETCGLGLPREKNTKIIKTPIRVPNLEPYADRIVYISGGKGWSEALLDDGTVIGWGKHSSLGIGVTKTSVYNDDPVIILENVQQLFARYAGSFAITNSGQLFTWGYTCGSCVKMIYGDSVTLRYGVNKPVVRIGGGKEHLFYETDDGKLYGVGYNDLYKLNQSKLCGIVDWAGSEIIIP